MLKKLFILTLSSIILLFILTTLKLDFKTENKFSFSLKKLENLNIASAKVKENKTDNSIGKLIIKKINIEENLYEITSSENTVEKNITILKNSIPPTNKNSIMFIAAHSGTGKIAYFKELNKLKTNDQIILIYKNQKYTYIVKDYWETDKTGYINVQKESQKQLILTTCSPNKKDKQLIINCIEKEPI